MRFLNTIKTTTPVLLALALLLTAGFLSGCQGEDSPRGATVEDLQLVRDNGQQVLRGKLVNTAERSIRGARVFVDLYDGPAQPGTQPADTASFEVQRIDAGEEKNFRHVLDTGLELTGARVARIVLF